jgi:hypothetical protein
MAIERNGGQGALRTATMVMRLLAGAFFLALSLVGGLFGLLYFVEFHGENTKAPDPIFSKVWGTCAMADAVLCLVAAVYLFRATSDPKAHSFAGREALIGLGAALLLTAVVLLRSEPR